MFVLAVQETFSGYERASFLFIVMALSLIPLVAPYMTMPTIATKLMVNNRESYP